ncbi:MerR family transcriptional regulator [Sedimentitalea sp. XS_ASV28]|uniref:MerR family transcriptional regulator n=1 Tax=Sedimentitalea sp. XS_ASV28 TaxID=3241296 RepID=UPI0035174284
MTKSPDAFRTISEVADWLGIQAHVLRFWESKFSQVKPVKRAGGRRYYRPADMQLLGGIKQLLYEDGLTIKGVQKILREQGVGHVASMSPPLAEPSLAEAAVTEGVTPSTPARADDAQETDQPFVEPQTEQSSEHTVEHTDEISETTPAATAPTTDDAAGTEPDASETEQEQLPLPQFTHRRPAHPAAGSPAPVTPDAQPADVSETAVPKETVAQQPKVVPLVVDAADPPDESDLPYSPGILADLAACDSLDARRVAAVVPLIGALEAWLDKASGAA